MKPDSKPSPVDDPVVLAVTGMTCAACAARIEKKLNKLDGVVATVNYATSKATVTGLQTRPEAGQLVSVIEGLGYGAVAPNVDDGESTVEIATEAHLVDVRRRLVVAVVCATPVMAMSMIGALQFDGWQWVSLVLAAPVSTWCAWPFHKSAWRNAAHRTTTMDTLISLGVIAAMAWSLWALVFGNAGEIGMRMNMSLLPRTQSHHGAMVHDEIYLEVATTLVAFILAGRWFEVRARRRAGDALRALLDLGAKSVTLWRDGNETVIPIGALGVGETFVVRPGETVATDGVVVEGDSSIDASMITGESVPVDCRPGDVVTGGTLNANGRLLVRATRIGRDTVLAQMARLVERAQDGKAPVQRLADKVSSVFVPAVIVLSVATLVGWLVISGDVQRSFEAAVAVLVIACPCALGLATPVALLVGTGRAAREGIIIKGAHVLEATRAVDTIVFDKTGTLTTGTMTLQSVDEESNSEHPIARAVVQGLRERGVVAAPSVENFVNTPGVGVSAVVDGGRVSVGRSTQSIDSGSTIVEATVDGRVVARLAVSDQVKPAAAAIVSQLRALGVRPMIVSGDSDGPVRRVAASIGIDPDDTRAGVLPADKLRIVHELQAAGATVAMVGDGVNDAAALVAADLGVAMGTGTDAAMEAGDLTIVNGDLAKVPRALALSRRTLGIIRANLFWAFAYNVAALPLAVAGLMNPVIAGLAMALSSVFVVTNSLRLRR
ncbi:MAG: cadmium-translocating P-type ATPase [Ilumatobacteraceae bacterium]|nr:cadmium-translocating P-type ATPase [Ilumatobacteraceae bacterium]